MAAGDYDSAAGRWQGIGPYYAMFPTHFADGVVADYTKPGDIVLDPFAGRGTAVFSAAHQGRQGIGIEINPVGWVYGKTKLGPAGQPEVAGRFREIEELAWSYRRGGRGPARILCPLLLGPGPPVSDGSPRESRLASLSGRPNSDGAYARVPAR